MTSCGFRPGPGVDGPAPPAGSPVPRHLAGDVLLVNEHFSVVVTALLCLLGSPLDE